MLPSSPNRYFLKGILAFAALLFGLISAEFLLRAAGYPPLKFKNPKMIRTQDSVEILDPIVGWRLRPGHYSYPMPQGAHLGSRYTFTIDKQGRRTTGGNHSGKPRILALGCSNTFGVCLSDEETFLYRLQQSLPSVEVLNFGVSGYGTYQCLLRLREYFLKEKDPVKAVLYFFIPHHQDRNVGTLKWLHAILLSRRYIYPLPYCQLDSKGHLTQRPPVVLPLWPFEENSALVHLLKEVVLKIRLRNREAQKQPVTEALFIKLKEECRKNNIPFYVVFFDFINNEQLAENKQYKKFAQENGIRSIDCADPRSVRNEMRLAGDINKHPGPELNQIWAKCLETQLRKEKLVPE